MNNNVQLDNIPPEIISQFSDQVLTTATNVFESFNKSQNNVYIIHGPSSEHLLKNIFPNIHNISYISGSDLYVEPGQVIHIHPPKSTMSIIFSGLKNNTIIIHSKLNHVLVRRSENINLDIKEGTISGIDIIHCHRMTIKMPCHIFTNLEFGEGIYFQAEINDISQLHITGSLDVKVNNTTIPINPFINAIFTNKGCFYKSYHEIPKLTIRK